MPYGNRRRRPYRATFRRRRARPMGRYQRRQVTAVVRRQLRKTIERKYFPNTAAYATVSNVGTITNLTVIPQGAGQSQRVGNIVKVANLTFRMDAYQGSGSAIAHTLRVIIFQWHNDSAVLAPSVANILQNTGSNIVTVSPYNIQGLQQKLFTIKYDRIWDMNSPDIGVSERRSFHRWQRIAFANSATTAEGHIYILLISDDPTTDINVQYTALVTYTDA